jgi:hypothetical protein
MNKLRRWMTGLLSTPQTREEVVAKDNLEAMAGCMRMLREDLIQAGIFDKSVPPMFMTEAILGYIGKLKHDIALQILTDQAQELDIGYGENACPRCGKSAPITQEIVAAGVQALEAIREGMGEDDLELVTDEVICTKIYEAMRGAQ